MDLALAFELLGKALQAEPRVVLGKIDAQLNDLPPTVLPPALPPALPLLLLFPAKNKPWGEGGGEGGREGGGVPIFVALSQPSPALQDLAEFLTTEGSFGTGLKVRGREGRERGKGEREGGRERGREGGPRKRYSSFISFPCLFT